MNRHELEKAASGDWAAIFRTIMLVIVLGVLTWVGTSINALRDQSSAQNVNFTELKTKFDDLNATIVPLSDAVPKLGRDIDKVDLQVADHERRITELEQVRKLH